jgi:anaerobic selenocysteine-containing dehydrogenase
MHGAEDGHAYAGGISQRWTPARLRTGGVREHPFTRGALCAKVNDYPARTYAPDRLLYPLRRTGPKGSGEFERISWNEALSTIAEHFSRVIAEHGPEALLPVNYLGSLGGAGKGALRRSPAEPQLLPPTPLPFARPQRNLAAIRPLAGMVTI